MSYPNTECLIYLVTEDTFNAQTACIFKTSCNSCCAQGHDREGTLCHSRMHLTSFSLALPVIINCIVLSSIFLSTSSSLAIKLCCQILIFFESFVWVIIIFTIFRGIVLLISKPYLYSLSAVINKFLKVSLMKKMVAQLRDFESKIQDLKLDVCSAS